MVNILVGPDVCGVYLRALFSLDIILHTCVQPCYNYFYSEDWFTDQVV